MAIELYRWLRDAVKSSLSSLKPVQVCVKCPCIFMFLLWKCSTLSGFKHSKTSFNTVWKVIEKSSGLRSSLFSSVFSVLWTFTFLIRFKVFIFCDEWHLSGEVVYQLVVLAYQVVVVVFFLCLLYVSQVKRTGR